MTHAPIIHRAADAMLAYLRWFSGPKRGPAPQTADAILTEYAGGDLRLYAELAQAAIEEATLRGSKSREAGKARERRRGAEPSVSAAHASEGVLQAREIVRAALAANHRTIAEQAREQVAAEAGVQLSPSWFYKRVWTPVRREMGIAGAGKRAGRRGA